jgi:hypothetical protein
MLPGSLLTRLRGAWIHWGHSLLSETALKSEHGVNNYLGNPLGHVQIRIHAFFISKEAAS